MKEFNNNNNNNSRADVAVSLCDRKVNLMSYGHNSSLIFKFVLVQTYGTRVRMPSSSQNFFINTDLPNFSLQTWTFLLWNISSDLELLDLGIRVLVQVMTVLERDILKWIGCWCQKQDSQGGDTDVKNVGKHTHGNKDCLIMCVLYVAKIRSSIATFVTTRLIVRETSTGTYFYFIRSLQVWSTSKRCFCVLLLVYYI